MARKVGILKPDQIGDEPVTYIKKSVALSLVRRMRAYWEKPFVIRMLPERVPKNPAENSPKPAKQIPQLKPPGLPFGLLIQYPLKDLRSVAFR